MTDDREGTNTRKGDLSALDWIGVVVASLGVVFCFQFPLMSPRFGKMFADFGGDLPAITRLGLTVWFPFLLGSLPLSCLVPAVGPWFQVRVRRALIVAAFVLSLGSIATCLYAMYAPIFRLAEAIK